MRRTFPVVGVDGVHRHIEGAMVMFRQRARRVHFVGIGGVGMSGIAEILLSLGHTISGSDLRLTEVTGRLERLGAKIREGHRREHLEDVDVVVISSAVHEDNPEVLAAREQKIPVIRRAEMLAELMRMKYGVAIAGTHGKTTTTSMVGQILIKAGLDPTLIVGGQVKNLGTNAVWGQGEYLVVEADEFDRSFLRLTPTVAVVTTIESEHLDCYRDLAEIKSAFVEFVNKVPFYGAVILCLDERSVQSIIPRVERRCLTYGLSSQATIQGRDVRFLGTQTDYTAWVSGAELGKVELHLPGLHNVKNSLAAIAVGLELDIPFPDMQEALREFGGVQRRFEIRGQVAGITVVDDYAHHPTEIEATLRAAKDGWDSRVIAVFQPHLYTRTRDFHREFGSSFYQADILIVTDVYPARENPIPGITGELVASAAREFGHQAVHYLPSKAEIPRYVQVLARPGDMIITLGAGDVGTLADDILRELEKSARGGP
jgi:UDP-N-acetylmuramate--alanine ligase